MTKIGGKTIKSDIHQNCTDWSCYGTNRGTGVVSDWKSSSRTKLCYIMQRILILYSLRILSLASAFYENETVAEQQFT